jgi:hypothetical protein
MALDTAVKVEFGRLPYAGSAPCATCGTVAYCRGVNIDSRVCIECFELVHKLKAPNYRRRRKPATTTTEGAATSMSSTNEPPKGEETIASVGRQALLRELEPDAPAGTGVDAIVSALGEVTKELAALRRTLDAGLALMAGSVYSEPRR